MNTPNVTAVKDIPAGMKVAKCSRCEGEVLVPVGTPVGPDFICEACSKMAQSAGSKDAADAVAAALGK